MHGIDKSAYFNDRAWSGMLKLAYEFGWQPEGPIMVGHIERAEMGVKLSSELDLARLAKERGMGDYFTNDGFVVTRSVATGIADALMRAIENQEQPIVRGEVDFSKDKEAGIGPEFRVDLIIGRDVEKEKLPVISNSLLIFVRQGRFRFVRSLRWVSMFKNSFVYVICSRVMYCAANGFESK